MQEKNMKISKDQSLGPKSPAHIQSFKSQLFVASIKLYRFLDIYFIKVKIVFVEEVGSYIGINFEWLKFH